MAYYVKTVTAGSEHDVRTWRYAIYHCDCCGEDSEFTVNPGFQTRERPCKHCKAMGTEDRLNTLKTNKNRIHKQIADLNMQLMGIDTEISELESKKNTQQQIEVLTK